MKNPQTVNLLPFLALASLFIKIGGATSLHPVLTGPDMAYLGMRTAFHCVSPDSPPPVTYELVKNGGVFIDSITAVEQNHPAQFSMRVTATSEGSYQCRATAGGSTAVSSSVRLSVVTPPSHTRVTSQRFPPVAYEGSRFVLSCDVSKGSHLSYTWFFNKTEITSPTSSGLLLTENKLVLRTATRGNSGFYSCKAWSRVQGIERVSSSTEVQVTVKVYVSKPRIAFSISKEEDGYHGNVTCWSATGSPPVNFSFSIDDIEEGSVTAADSLAAWFPVAMVPGVDMGVARCRVNTAVQELMSDAVTLVVVPVGGNVKVEVEYLYRADAQPAAVRLGCRISKGTFPHVSWLLNNSVLASETHKDSHFQPVLSHYAMADHRQTLVLTKLGPEHSGYYRCRVRDSYDNSGPWVESAAVLIHAKDRILINSMTQNTSSTETPPNVPFITIEWIAIAFCCFLLLVLAVSVGCVLKMFDQKQAHAHIVTAHPPSDAPPPSQRRPSPEGLADTSATECNVHDQTTDVTV